MKFDLYNLFIAFWYLNVEHEIDEQKNSYKRVTRENTHCKIDPKISSITFSYPTPLRSCMLLRINSRLA